MYKRILCLVLSFFFILAFTGCQPNENEGPYYDINKMNAYQVTLDGFEYRKYELLNQYNYIESKDTYYIDDYDSLQNIVNPIFDKYDETYFENNSLEIVTIIDYVGNKYSNPNNHSAEIIRSVSNYNDLINWTIVLEIDKEFRSQYIIFINKYANSSDVFAENIRVLTATMNEFNYSEIDLTTNYVLFPADSDYLYRYDSVEDVQKIGRAYFNKYDDAFFEQYSLILLPIIDSPFDNVYRTSYSIDDLIVIQRRISEEVEYKNVVLVIEVNKEYKDFPVELLIDTSKYHKVHNFKEVIVKEPTCLYKGYKVTKCECGESLGETILDEVECKYENGRCIWCGGKENK